MRLEPNNQELKKQHMETKSLLEKVSILVLISCHFNHFFLFIILSLYC